MKKSSIYTGTGDSGSTSLCGGTRILKSHPRVEAYGTLDELNAHLGLLAASLEDTGTIDFITKIENDIFTIGCYLATENNEHCPIDNDNIKKLEQTIDDITASLPPLNSFILPPNSEQSARANVCRTICRRAERAIVALDKENPVSHNALTYINRLSDYLFTLQRQLLNGEEKMWQKPCK